MAERKLIKDLFPINNVYAELEQYLLESRPHGIGLLSPDTIKEAADIFIREATQNNYFIFSEEKIRQILDRYPKGANILAEIREQIEERLKSSAAIKNVAGFDDLLENWQKKGLIQEAKNVEVIQKEKFVEKQSLFASLMGKIRSFFEKS